MYFSKKESGIPLSDELIGLLNLAKDKAGRQSVLARGIGITEANLCTWMGNNAKQQNMTISWPQWAKVREYLLKEHLIDSTDPRWMLPSEMRQRLLDLNVDAEVSQLLAYFSQLSPTGKNTALNVIRSLIPTLNQEASTSGMSVTRQA